MFSHSRIAGVVCSFTLPILLALLLAAIPLSSSAAPSAAGDPVYVGGLSQVGLPGQNYAPLMEEALTTDLSKKFSCTDFLNRDDIERLIGLARMQQLLGTPEDQQVNLQTIADALGRAGTLVFGSFGKMGNSYYLNIKIANLRTATVTSNQMFTKTGSDDTTLLDLMRQAVSQSELKPCRPKWTGTLSVTEKSSYFLQKPGYMPILANATRNPRTVGVTNTDRTEEIRATIPGLVGPPGDPNKIDVNVTHTINESGFIYNLATQDVDCSGSWGRQMRGDFEWRPWIYETDTTWTEDANDTQPGTLTVNIDSNGHYKITWSAPSMKYQRTQSSFGRNHPTPCEGPKNIQSEPIRPEFTSPPRTITIEGDVDPRNPDTLSGETTENVPEWTDPTGAKNTSSTTKKWRLTATKNP